MVGGLVFSGIFLAAPLVVHGALAFVVMRALAGLATSAYDPAARGFIIDAMPAEKQGEAFGWYGSFQMSGLFVGPAIGGFGALWFGGIGFGLVFGGITSLLAAVAVGLTVREGPRRGVAPAVRRARRRDRRPGRARVVAERRGRSRPGRPSRRACVNRLLIAAIVLNASGNFGGGHIRRHLEPVPHVARRQPGPRGADFSMFSIPVLVLGPIVGRLVDRRGTLGFLDPGLVHGRRGELPVHAHARPVPGRPDHPRRGHRVRDHLAGPVRDRRPGQPGGRSSTAQGVYGAFGTVGFIVASLIAGVLASGDMRHPFYLFSAVSFGFLALALLVGGRAIRATEPSVAGRGGSPRPAPSRRPGHLTGFVTEPAIEPGLEVIRRPGPPPRRPGPRGGDDRPTGATHPTRSSRRSSSSAAS